MAKKAKAKSTKTGTCTVPQAAAKIGKLGGIKSAAVKKLAKKKTAKKK